MPPSLVGHAGTLWLTLARSPIPSCPAPGSPSGFSPTGKGLSSLLGGSPGLSFLEGDSPRWSVPSGDHPFAAFMKNTSTTDLKRLGGDAPAAAAAAPPPPAADATMGEDEEADEGDQTRGDAAPGPMSGTLPEDPLQHARSITERTLSTLQATAVIQAALQQYQAPAPPAAMSQLGLGLGVDQSQLSSMAAAAPPDVLAALIEQLQQIQRQQQAQQPPN